MKTVKKTSIFPASKKKVFSRLLKLKTLQYIAYPYATFTPMDGADSMSWEVGSTSRFKFRLFGVIPFGTHTIHVIRFGLDEGIYTHEGNEHVPTWNHEIILEELQGNRCRYTDKAAESEDIIPVKLSMERKECSFIHMEIKRIRRYWHCTECFATGRNSGNCLNRWKKHIMSYIPQ